VVNAELLGDERVSLQLDDVPERQAIEVVLRSAAGYVALERGTDTAGPSIFRRILVLAPSGLPAATATPPPTAEAAGSQPSAENVMFDSPVFSPNVEEPPNGRPKDARPIPASAIPGFTAAAGATTPGTSIVEEPPNGRPKDARQIPASAIPGFTAPAEATTPGTSTTLAAAPRPGSGEAEDVNGRKTKKP
jgi:hypothetical protein